ncbi:uncharacterized protein LOC106159853 [Lingula anatina]|uniref:Uncharacterized protein LOC106159853 n=1 Tax=Lingula anatina TaxID=7574 RepID=A0A2R2MI51_LINAN|nr:uncharacterized protein LOC106159853 [Lingula anatina]|eukprot:XP_023929901.1 uncharacterized protein LOC106159853 [Lingula anatina]
MKQLGKAHCQERERITAELNVVYDAEQKNKYKKQIQLICIRQRKLGQCFRLHAQISMKWRKTKRNLPKPTAVQSIQKRSLPRSVPITCAKENELETVRKKVKEIPLDVSKGNKEKSKEPVVIYLQPNSRQPQEEVMSGKLHDMAHTKPSDLLISCHHTGTQAVTILEESYTSSPSIRATPGSKPVFPSHMDSHKLSSNSAIAPLGRAPVADSAPMGMLQTSTSSSVSSEIVFSETPLGIGAPCNGFFTTGTSSAPDSSSHGSKYLSTEQGKAVLARTQNSHAIPTPVTPVTGKVNLTTSFPPTAQLPSSVPTVSGGKPLVLQPESRLSLSDKQTMTAGTGQPTTVTVSAVQQQITSVACSTASTSGYILPPMASKSSASYLLSAEILNPHKKKELSQYQLTNTTVTGTTKTAATVTLSSSVSAVKPAAFPTLKELIKSNVITPEPNSMFIIMPNKMYVASLLPSGQIQGAGGETFKTPTQWCSAVLPVPVRKSTAYQRVFYKSKPLSSYKIPIPEVIQDTSIQPPRQQPVTLNTDCSENVSQAPPALEVPVNTQAAYYPGTKENVEERPGLHNLLRKCTIYLTGTEELLPSDSYLPADFWTADCFQDVTFSQDLIADIDKW